MITVYMILVTVMFLLLACIPRVYKWIKNYPTTIMACIRSKPAREDPPRQHRQSARAETPPPTPPQDTNRTQARISAEPKPIEPDTCTSPKRECADLAQSYKNLQKLSVDYEMQNNNLHDEAFQMRLENTNQEAELQLLRAQVVSLTELARRKDEDIARGQEEVSELEDLVDPKRSKRLLKSLRHKTAIALDKQSLAMLILAEERQTHARVVERLKRTLKDTTAAWETESGRTAYEAIQLIRGLKREQKVTSDMTQEIAHFKERYYEACRARDRLWLSCRRNEKTTETLRKQLNKSQRETARLKKKLLRSAGG